MWLRAARALRSVRRALLLLPLLLTALALLLLPRPPLLDHPLHSPSPPVAPAPPLPVEHLQSLDGKEEDKLKRDEPEEEFHDDDVSIRPWYMRGGEQQPKKHDPDLPLFPEDAPGDDRIVQQLMYKLPNDDVPIKKILLANGLSSWGVSAGRQEFIKNNCPVDRCSLTADSRDAGTVDAILFKDHHTPFNVPRPPKQIWILYYLECPYHTASLRPSSMDLFNWTATYRRDSDIVAPYERWVYHDPAYTENKMERNFAANKTKKVAWFVSNCHASNRRLQYARKLSKLISVDIFGACGSQHCPRADPHCLEMLNKDYKFYLAFENSNCRDYITEKFFVNGLQHNVIPIVMGARASEYAAAAPHNSYVHVDEFTGPEELAAYLRRLDENDTLYNSYFKWKGTGEFINTYFFCRVCAMVHANDVRGRTGHYTDVQAWWRNGACTRANWRSAEHGTRDNG
ncbi:glycoprotein 3-alpha-L-fucosyltransferase A isoform X2 [Plodia interpunctella]|nr:glycoprotein 3-alpha-L-fucosyltransferase A isoform X2 [Plodia interpunctella]XP_053615988.1 glycoprotein 3-alpha-L-fucosyltransferase A isoform X2 [Plodia interpunctella]XP_053615989.1 glycoprotein 3-alpha-L-fucosyltransferase A isoform X2 [Plodia interpunctella]XP_053615990.1 glycoprotein 3-alpha-L-fucosyltransferase A isoform X2 [Plodia interpunctella]